MPSRRCATSRLSPKSRFHRWVDVTGAEIRAFLGLIVSMGVIVIDYLEDYWSTDCMYKLPFYSAVMKKERFCLILSFLHLCNNEDQVPQGQPGHDPIFKIRSFVDRLQENFKMCLRTQRQSGCRRSHGCLERSPCFPSLQPR